LRVVRCEIRFGDRELCLFLISGGNFKCESTSLSPEMKVLLEVQMGEFAYRNSINCCFSFDTLLLN
jgi:hypothetical protein